MWRWLVPVGLTSFAAIWLILANQMYSIPPHGEYPPGAVTLTWLRLMATGIPTILLYRLLIAAGERILPRRPLAGAVAMVLAGALLPPLACNLWVAGASGGRDFTGSVPARADTIGVEDTSASRETAEVGIAPCGDACLRLLFGGAARRVVVGDPKADASLIRRSHWAQGEPILYAPAPALHLERRSICPPVVTNPSAWARTGNFVGAPRVGPSMGGEPGTRTEDRALALIAAGQCLVAEPARFSDAELILGLRVGRDPRDGPQPHATGLYGYAYQFIDRRAGTGWTRLSQRMELSHVRRWTYPFAILPSRAGWIAATLDTTARNEPDPDRSQTWRPLGFTLPDIPQTGWRRVREMLAAAIALPRTAPRDARHQLAPQYLALLRTRPADATDRTLLPRLIADPRIAPDDLHLGRFPEARLVIPALLARIRHPDTRDDDLRRLVHTAYELEVDRPALFAMLREAGADPGRGREFRRLLDMYTALDRQQAEARRAPASNGAAVSANGARPADFGFSGTRPFRPMTFALDLAALAGIHLVGLVLALTIRGDRRLKGKALPATEGPVQATP